MDELFEQFVLAVKDDCLTNAGDGDYAEGLAQGAKLALGFVGRHLGIARIDELLQGAPDNIFTTSNAMDKHYS